MQDAQPQNCTCYECGHDYGFLGVEPHPGVCPACGSRAVSFSGSVTVVDPDDDDVEEFVDVGLANVLHIWGRDRTDRRLSWHVDLVGTCQQPTLRHVRIDEQRILPRDSEWSDSLVPQAVHDAIREETGSELAIPDSDREGR